MPELLQSQIPDDAAADDLAAAPGCRRGGRPPVPAGADRPHLERELSALFTAAHPRQGLEWGVRAPGGPRVLSLGELEALRDDLAARLDDTRRTLRDRGYVETRNRERIEEMIAEPQRFKWVRISNDDIGEPGCKHWHARPRSACWSC